MIRYRYYRFAHATLHSLGDASFVFNGCANLSRHNLPRGRSLRKANTHAKQGSPIKCGRAASAGCAIVCNSPEISETRSRIRSDGIGLFDGRSAIVAYYEGIRVLSIFFRFFSR